MSTSTTSNDSYYMLIDDSIQMIESHLSDVAKAHREKVKKLLNAKAEIRFRSRNEGQTLFNMEDVISPELKRDISDPLHDL